MIITLCYRGETQTYEGDALDVLQKADKKVVEWQSA